MIRSDKKLIVRSKDQGKQLPITSLDFSSFTTTWEKNSSYQLAFTAYDDGGLAFNLLLIENSLIWDGQEYIIKQATDSYSSGVHSVQVTATHVYYQLNNRRQYDVNKGDVSFTLESALSFLFAPTNDYGYVLHGDFGSSHTLTDFGNCSITDGISTLSSSFGIYAVVPDNHVVHLYSKANWVKDTNKAYYYRHDTSEVSLQYDSTGIVNRVQVVSTNEVKQFDPFYVTDDDSIKEWGIHDGERVENDKDNNTGANIATANRMMVPQPSIALTVNTLAENIEKGELWTLVIPENGIQTKVQVVSITDTPFLPNTKQVSLNNTRQNFLDTFNARDQELTKMKDKMTSGYQQPNMWVIGKADEK